MIAMVKWAVLLCALAPLGGCLAYWTAPLNTQVVNAYTRQPLVGARVLAWPMEKKEMTKTFVTDDSGRVEIPSFRFFLPFPGDAGLAMPLTLRVDADGFAAVDLQDLLGQTGIVELAPVGAPE